MKGHLKKNILSKKANHIETPKPFDFSYSEYLKKDADFKKNARVRPEELEYEAFNDISEDFDNKESSFSRRLCPDCSAFLEHEGGCVICRNCGYSKCG